LTHFTPSSVNGDSESIIVAVFITFPHARHTFQIYDRQKIFLPSFVDAFALVCLLRAGAPTASNMQPKV
jgi:hypothetical protein